MFIKDFKKQQDQVIRKKFSIQLRGNFKNAWLLAAINVFNIIFFFCVLIWIGSNIGWKWEIAVIWKFIQSDEAKSIGWGIFLSLIIFTIINGIFFIAIYFRIFTSSIIFIGSNVGLKKNVKVLSITNICLIILYIIGWIITIIGFAIFLHEHPLPIVTASNVTGTTSNMSWVMYILLVINLVPFFIILTTFFSLKNTEFAHKK